MKYIKTFEEDKDWRTDWSKVNVGCYSWPLSEEEKFIVLAKSGDKYIPKIREEVQKGVNVDVKDRFGTTALIYAANVREMNMIRALLDLGADWNNKHQGRTFLDELSPEKREIIINEYPEKYKEFLMKKEAEEKYNL